MTVSRTIARDGRPTRPGATSPSSAVTVVGLSRLLEPPLVWLVAARSCSARCCSARSRSSPTRRRRPRPSSGVPIESLILPAVAAVACLGAIRLVPFGLWLAPGARRHLAHRRRTLALEARINRGPAGLTADDRTAVLVTILLVAFLAFTGVAAMVPGGLVQPASAAARCPRRNLLVLAGGRRARRGPARLPRGVAAGHEPARRALVAPLTYAVAIAIGAAALRAMEIPRLSARPC